MDNLQNYMLENEVIVRLEFFIGTIVIVALLEYLLPRRELLVSKTKRWLNNFLLVFFNSLLLKIVFPIAAFGVALYMEDKNFGLLNLVEIPFFLQVIISIILLDLLIYWQHRFSHEIEFFWRFHKAHHCDMDFDLTTGIRFHPLEILFSMLLKIIAVVLIGAPALAVILFEVILNSFSIFTHSNVYLPKSLDKILRFVIVTPDFHRVHHSIHKFETNSNYTFFISLWDRFFKSYVPYPKDKHGSMTIGLEDFQDEDKTVSIFQVLKIPFLKKN